MQIPKKYRMSSIRIKEFISYYERVTKNLLKNYQKFLIATL